MNNSLAQPRKVNQNGSKELEIRREIPFEPTIKELVIKFREIPMGILSPAFRIVEMEAIE